MAPLDRGVMTRKEAAAALGISHRVLSAKVAAGIIPLEPVPWSDYRQLTCVPTWSACCLDSGAAFVPPRTEGA